ncbi:hypothetical protein Naga_101464g1 [Nannochloropsis gaditana]|uniref:Uncharacterized protein n=1 Tax=Nannochloropsis gaditana TaxID=72520 RepID=W7T0A5_9STRA|nr:hypothetical protein Naga_101464g1 [Nannochloropsis gaditana]
MRAIRNKSCEWEMTVPKARASERKKEKSTTPCLRRPDSLICHSPILQFPLLTHAVVPKITASCAQSCVSSSPPSVSSFPSVSLQSTVSSAHTSSITPAPIPSLRPSLSSPKPRT